LGLVSKKNQKVFLKCMKNMENNIVISINPEHVKNIISGTKKYEYRTKAAKRDIDKIIIYETVPVKRIVADVQVIGVLKGKPDDLWERTKDKSGITKAFFDDYFKNRKTAYAYELGEVKVYDSPKNLEEFGLKRAPQSYVYVSWEKKYGKVYQTAEKIS